MRYEAIPELSCEELASDLNSRDSDKIRIAVLSAALYCEDEDKAMAICLDHLKSSDEWIVRCSLAGLGHIARIRRNINFDVARVEEEIRRLGLEATVGGTVDDLRRDIRKYILRHHGLH